MNKINFSALTDTVDLESQNDPCFDVPSRMGIYGPSQSGKSTLILNSKSSFTACHKIKQNPEPNL